LPAVFFILGKISITRDNEEPGTRGNMSEQPDAKNTALPEDLLKLLETPQEQFPISGTKEWVIDICRRLGDWFEARRKDSEELAAFEAGLNHLKKWPEHVKPYSIYHTARLTWLQAYPPYHRGKYRDALQLVQTAMSLLDQVQAPESEMDDFFKLKANLFHDIAAVQDELENTEEALKYYRQALEVRPSVISAPPMTG
jgi:tetratricopeptide (TPR) repeat protein